MNIAISGTLNMVDDIFMYVSTDLTPTEIPVDWFIENLIGYLQAIFIFESGKIQYQFGRTRGLPENPEINRLILKPNILDNLCIHLKSGLDEIICYQLIDNALLGLWSGRRKEGDLIEILLVI